VDQEKRLKKLEQDISKLTRLIAELSLDKHILQDIARETSKLERRRTLWRKPSSAERVSVMRAI
jgi:hypothetical protein